MENKINGRTPEEIKKALSCSITQECLMGECVYRDAWHNKLPGGCFTQRGCDTLAYIQQLERHIGELTEMVQQLERERNAAVMDLEACCPCEVCTRSCKYDKVNAYSECADFEWRGAKEEQHA